MCGIQRVLCHGEVFLLDSGAAHSSAECQDSEASTLAFVMMGSLSAPRIRDGRKEEHETPQFLSGPR